MFVFLKICTCTESGNIIIWSLIQRQVTPELLSEDQGLTIWGSVVLVQGLVIQLHKINPDLKELQCFDLAIHDNDSNHLFVATNQGVLHCLISGMKPKPKLYTTGINIKLIMNIYSNIYLQNPRQIVLKWLRFLRLIFYRAVVMATYNYIPGFMRNL